MEHAAESTKQNGRLHSRGAPARPASIEEPPLHLILQLQRQVGNQAVLAMLRSGALQAKLEIGSVEDPLEHEADRVAERVMRMTDPAFSIAATPPQISRKCAACEDEEKLRRTKPAAGPQAAAGEVPGIVHEVLRSPGQPLDPATRSYFEPRFGHDFSRVRVHVDTAAAESAQRVNALAYTVGSDMAFAPQMYAPHLREGRRLLAHELAHVMQHSAGAPGAVRRKVPGAQCTGVRIALPNTIVFEGNKGAVSATVKTSLTPSETPYAIEYNAAEGEFVITPGEKVTLIEISLSKKPQSEIDLYISYRDSLTSKQVGLEVFPTSASVAGGSVDPRHARGYAGEQGMGFGYKQEGGWIFVEGPSGSAGHGVTTAGFDGVAYNTEADELHLIDNKSLKAETVRSATALTRNLLKNLDGLIKKVEGIRDMPSRIRILQLLKQMRASVAAGKTLPKNTKLIVTGVGGQSKEVSQPLEELGVEFREPGVADAPLSPTPPETPTAPETATPPETTTPPEAATPPEATTPEGVIGEPPVETPGEFTPTPKGGKPGIVGGLFGFALPLIAGFIHQRAVERRIEEKAHKEGYVPYGAPSGEGFLYDLGSWFLDPGNEADKAVSFDKRFDLPVWRQRLRDVANGKQVGDTLKMQWDVPKCALDLFGHQEFTTRRVTYKKQADGKWKVESGDASGIWDLNDIISTSVSDQKIKSFVYDPCSA